MGELKNMIVAEFLDKETKNVITTWVLTEEKEEVEVFFDERLLTFNVNQLRNVLKEVLGEE